MKNIIISHSYNNKSSHRSLTHFTIRVPPKAYKTQTSPRSRQYPSTIQSTPIFELEIKIRYP